MMMALSKMTSLAAFLKSGVWRSFHHCCRYTPSVVLGRASCGVDVGDGFVEYRMGFEQMQALLEDGGVHIVSFIQQYIPPGVSHTINQRLFGDEASVFLTKRSCCCSGVFFWVVVDGLKIVLTST